MEQEFLDWFEANEKSFAHGQFDDKQIAYSAWLEGRKVVNKNDLLPDVSRRVNELLKLREELKNQLFVRPYDQRNTESAAIRVCDKILDLSEHIDDHGC